MSELHIKCLFGWLWVIRAQLVSGSRGLTQKKKTKKKWWKGQTTDIKPCSSSPTKVSWMTCWTQPQSRIVAQITTSGAPSEAWNISQHWLATDILNRNVLLLIPRCHLLTSRSNGDLTWGYSYASSWDTTNERLLVVFALQTSRQSSKSTQIPELQQLQFWHPRSCQENLMADSSQDVSAAL